MAVSVCAIRLLPDQEDGADLEAMGTDATSAMLVTGPVGDVKRLGTDSLIVHDLTTESVVGENANDASRGWTAFALVEEQVVDPVLTDTRCLGVRIRLR